MPITIKREYSILPQGDGDRDHFHHHIKDKPYGTSYHYACLIGCVALVILLILAGVAGLTASVFFGGDGGGIKMGSFGHFWWQEETSINQNDEADTNHMDTTAAAPARDDSFNPADNSPEESASSSSSSSSPNINGHGQNSRNGSSGSSEEQLGGEGESDSDADYSSRNSTESSNGNGTTMENNGDVHEGTVMSGVGDVDVEKLKEKFAEAMRNLEKDMENVMGIRRAEFVVPIFMLACFLSFFSLISLCCCFMMRRKDQRRKKLFGKLITDLQTGDSKTVLLNHSDFDD